MTSDCQVLVVGAGPTGLVLACELLARGIRARIIDQGDGVVLQTRALGVHARTLEVFDMMGLAERFVEHGQVVRRFHMYTDGKTSLLDYLHRLFGTSQARQPAGAGPAGP